MPTSSLLLFFDHHSILKRHVLHIIGLVATPARIA
jgi:hypothetical protein